MQCRKQNLRALAHRLRLCYGPAGLGKQGRKTGQPGRVHRGKRTAEKPELHCSKLAPATSLLCRHTLRHSARKRHFAHGPQRMAWQILRQRLRGQTGRTPQRKPQAPAGRSAPYAERRTGHVHGKRPLAKRPFVLTRSQTFRQHHRAGVRKDGFDGQGRGRKLEKMPFLS